MSSRSSYKGQPRKYAFPRSIARSMERKGRSARVSTPVKTEPAFQTVERIHPSAAAIRETFRAAFRAVKRFFRAPKGR